jgi:hypothetical protein
MEIDPMNNISNNNKNTLCSYIISTWKRVGGLRSSSMTYCAKERRHGCGKILNGLVNGIFT